MKIKAVISAALVMAVIIACLPLGVLADDRQFTVTFTDGLNLTNPLTGQPPTGIFTGEPVDPVTVKEGGSFVLPENTIIFRDYVFDGWKYVYTDENGEKQTAIYQPGDTYSGVASDMEFGAVWKRPDPIDLEISGFLTFKCDEPYVEGELPAAQSVIYNSTIKLPKASLSRDGYTFLGWVDSDGLLYENGGEYVVNKLNPILNAAWAKDGSAALTHKVVYEAGSDDVVGEMPRPLEMYRKETFVAAECGASRQGWTFVCWIDESGREYVPGSEYTVQGELLTLKPKWEKVISYCTVTVTATDGGSVSPISDVKVEKNKPLEIHAEPYEGYALTSFVVNGTECYNGDGGAFDYTIADVDSDMTVLVTFEKKPNYDYSFIVLSGEGELLGLSTHDGDRAFTLKPGEGYRLKEVFITGASYRVEDGVYTLYNITGDVTISAAFEQIPVTDSSDVTKEPNPGENRGFYYALLAVLLVGMVVFAAIYAFKRR